MDQEYNSPQFTKFMDSLGNIELLSSTNSKLNYINKTALRPGENLRFEVEVDSSFSPENYFISWEVTSIHKGDKGSGTSFSLTIQDRHVNERFGIQVLLVSTRGWHRHGNYDARLTITYKVLPPLAS